MNIGALLKVSFFQKIISIVDVIPKLVYFLCAAFLSCIDILQNIVRKLAGLDVYYMKDMTGTMQPVVQQDPLTEFIYGILGYGESAYLYKGLNTVFWSLAVFAIICLAVTTMIAIIKSHYNEDVAGTNPWKYVYTAIKAVLAFAVIPFTVVIGMKLASWALITLDQITAGSANDGTIEAMYGPEGTQIFKKEPLKGVKGDDVNEYYTNYDFFGAGSTTSSTPFSGLMFKASAYEANRARKENQVTLADYTELKSGGKQIFANSADFQAATTNTIKLEIVAEQVDFAFANNLQLNTRLSKDDVIGEAFDNVRYWEPTDFIGGIWFGAGSFSKYHVGLVWIFYDLWQFNALIGLAGGTTMLGIMLSVIIGLMSRLLKGSILFLVYPALLGIAPLDNFKAFKSWGTQFMQQVMMAMGAIIGMNLTLLILPYAQTIKFFNIGIIDSIVNTVIVITGLMMMKDIISIFSSFVGGADAQQTGAGLKGEVGKAIGGAAKTAGIMGIGATAAVGGAMLGVGKLGVKAYRGIQANKAREMGILGKDETYADLQMRSANINRNTKRDNFLDKLKGNAGAQAAMTEAYEDAYTDPANKDLSPVELENKANAAKLQAGRAYYLNNRGEFGKETAQSFGEMTKAETKYDQTIKHFKFKTDDNGDWDGRSENETKDAAKAEKANRIAEAGGRIKYTAGNIGRAISGAIWGYEKDEEGNVVKDANGNAKLNAPTFGSAMQKMFIEPNHMKEAGKHLADGFLKSMVNIGEATGIDKLVKGMGGIFEKGFTYKEGVFDTKEKPAEGDKLTSQLHEKAEANAQTRAKKLEDQNTALLKAIENLTQTTSRELKNLGTKFTSK